jgi:hypothetical protein
MAVLMAAFTAHRTVMVLDLENLSRVETAVRYQIWHALALLAVAALCRGGATRALVLSAVCFVLGSLFFLRRPLPVRFFGNSYLRLVRPGWRRIPGHWLAEPGMPWTAKNDKRRLTVFIQDFLQLPIRVEIDQGAVEGLDEIRPILWRKQYDAKRKLRQNQVGKRSNDQSAVTSSRA